MTSSSLKKDVEDLEKSVRELREERKIYRKALKRVEYVMAKLVSKIRGGESFRKCDELRKKIEYIISNLPRYDLEAMRLVDYFKPFNHRRKIIPLTSTNSYLVIGNTIYVVPDPKERRQPSEDEVFQTLIRYADIITPNVRKSIREELAEFCRLGEELMVKLEGELASRKGRFRTLSLEYDHSEGLTFVRLGWQTYNKVSIYIDFTATAVVNRCTLHLINTNTGGKIIENVYDVCYSPLYFCELYDTLAEMLEEAYEKLQAKKERCEAIIKEMKKIVAPFVLSEL